MCTFSMDGRDFERKKYSVRTGKIIRERKHILLFIIGKFFKLIYLLTQFGNLFGEKKWSRNFYRRKFIQYHNREINVCKKKIGGMEDCTVDCGSCTDNAFLFSSPIS